MKKIRDLTFVLKAIRVNFQGTTTQAFNEKKQALKDLKANYLQGGQEYVKRQREIDKAYTTALVSAKKRATEQGQGEINDLKEYELTKIGRMPSDGNTMQTLKALSNVPLSQAELQVLAEQTKGNYWQQKILHKLAEDNGIEPESIGLSNGIDSRLNVLDELSDQLNDMIENFNPSGHDLTPEQRKARFLLLNDDILNNAISMFNGDSSGTQQGLSRAEKAYIRIHAADGYSKAGLIEQSMRSIKKESDRNELLYKLAMDTAITDDVADMSGIGAELQEWRTGGKSQRYEDAVKLSQDIDRLTDSEAITATLRAYALRNEQTGAGGNEFMSKMLADKIEKSDNVRSAVQELTRNEMKSIMSGGDSEGDIFKPKFM